VNKEKNNKNKLSFLDKIYYQESYCFFTNLNMIIEGCLEAENNCFSFERYYLEETL